MSLVPGSLSVWQILVGAIWLVLQRATAFEFTELDRLLTQAVSLALDQIFMTQKEAAFVMGMSESHFGKCLRRVPEHHLSLNRLIRLPFRFWVHFSALLVYVVAKQNALDIAEDLGLRRVR